MSELPIKDQFSSEIAPGVECYHKGAVLFAGGEEHREQAEQLMIEWNLTADEAEIKHDSQSNITVVLLKDIVR